MDEQTVKGTADEIAMKIGINFKCSNGWLQCYNITCHSLSGEGASADLDSTEKWRENVKPIITQYALDIFNLDEMALFYNAQPKRTLALKGEKGYKDRVTSCYVAMQLVA